MKLKIKGNVNKKNEILDILKTSAIILFIFIIINIAVSSVLFFAHISISNNNFLIALMLTIIFTIYYFRKKTNNKIIIIASILSIIIFITSIFICSKTYDLTWDGNTYHKLAVGMLKNGWNPIYEKAEDYIANDIDNIGIKDDGKNSIWIEHYPKASWIFAANMYSVTNNIECSKILNLLMAYICFSIVLSYMNKKTNLIWACIIALLVTINPITIVQTLNFYIDGIMSLTIYMIIFVFVDKYINKGKEDDSDNNLILTLSLILCINLKFTGLIYAAFFCFMFFVLDMYRAYKNKDFTQEFFRYVKLYTCIVGISVVIIGYSSYIKNQINNGNFFYPLMGKNKVDIMTYNEPKSFQTRNVLDKFVTSIFGVSENVKSNVTDNDPKTKIPFTIKEKEIEQYNKPDLRISGFGVWFSGIIIISILVIVYQMCKDKDKENNILCLAFAITCSILILLTDGSWWARYTPYLYLIPIIALYMLVKKGKKEKILAALLSTLMVINISFIFYTTLKTYNEKYTIIKNNINIMKKSDKTIDVYVDDQFSSVLYNLKDNNIKFKVIKDKAKLKNPQYVNNFYYDKK